MTVGILGRFWGEVTRWRKPPGNTFRQANPKTTALSRYTGNAIVETGSSGTRRAGRYYKENPRGVQRGLLAYGDVLMQIPDRGRR